MNDILESLPLVNDGVPILPGSRHSWLCLGETPENALPPSYDIVGMGLGLGLPTIDYLADTEAMVGPLKYCLTHLRLFVPVESGTADWWWPSQAECSSGTAAQCPSGGCRTQWVASPKAALPATTAARALHDALCRMRSRMRSPQRQLGWQARETCRV
ncbi:hypothetical protein ACFYXM_10620 [Streptomyces sp. NPDC002476]|uniref:hypothetical protein n=1 Tax=Streptomyces sp. NPDC002476 TaxID=3364648 RepID=UPI003675933D